MDLTKEEIETVTEVLSEKREALETNAQRAIKRLIVYQKSPDCATLYQKAKGTVEGNIRRIAALDRTIGKIKA